MGDVGHPARRGGFFKHADGMGVFVLIALLTASPSAAAPGHFEQKSALVERILKQSGTSQRANDQARGLLQQAEEKLKAARGEKDPARADKLLGEAIQLATRASRATGPDLTWLHKEQYESLVENLEVLKKTFHRHATRLQPGSAPPPLPGVEEKVAQARAAASAKDYKRGVALLKEAQRTLAREMRTLLGKTLVYELKFASPKEEYEYEVGRMDGLDSLMALTLAETALEPIQEQLIRKYRDQSLALQRTGHNQAEKKEFAAAIKSMEEANELLLRALRALGLPM